MTSNFYLTNSSSSHSLSSSYTNASNGTNNNLKYKTNNNSNNNKIHNLNQQTKSFDLSQIVDEPIDSYLESIGLWKKRIARDGSCLFRAVAEQISSSQMCHDEVRQECVRFMCENRKDYEHFVTIPFDEYLEAMRNPLEYAGQLEILAMSKLYKRDFIIYHEPKQMGVNVTQNGFDENIILCFSYNNHYDAVFTKKYRDDLALMQSLVYEILYENVFGSGDQVSVARRLLRKSDTIYPKEFMDIKNHSEDNYENEDDSMNMSEVDFENYSVKYQKENENEQDESQLEATIDDAQGIIDINNNNLQNTSQTNTQQQQKQQQVQKMPLPYKVAKSLDPVIYRNTAFDAWIATKKETEECLNQKLVMQLKQNDKCFVKTQNYYGTNWILAYMQSFHSNNTAYVFIPEIQERQLVTLDNIKVYTSDSYIITNNIKNVQKCVQPVNAQFQKLIQTIENKRRNLKKKQFTMKKSASFHLFTTELPTLVEVNEEQQVDEAYFLQHFHQYYTSNGYQYAPSNDYQATPLMAAPQPPPPPLPPQVLPTHHMTSHHQVVPQMVHSQSSYAQFNTEKVPFKPYLHQNSQNGQNNFNKNKNPYNHYTQQQQQQHRPFQQQHQQQAPLLPNNPKLTLPNIAPYGTHTWHNLTQSSPATYYQSYAPLVPPPPPPPPPSLPQLGQNPSYMPQHMQQQMPTHFQAYPAPHQMSYPQPQVHLSQSTADAYYQYQQNRKRHESFDSYLNKQQYVTSGGTTASTLQKSSNDCNSSTSTAAGAAAPTNNYLLMPAPTTSSNTNTSTTSSGLHRSHSYHAGISNAFNYEHTHQQQLQQQHTQTPVYIDMYIPHAPPMYAPPPPPQQQPPPLLPPQSQTQATQLPQMVVPQSASTNTNLQNSIENQINYDTNALLDDSNNQISNGWSKSTNTQKNTNGCLFQDLIASTQLQQQQQQQQGDSNQFTIYNNATDSFVVNIKGPIDFNASHSLHDDGSDLQCNDIGTIRFFYNLGIEYYRLNIINSNQNANYNIYQTQSQSINEKNNEDINRKLQ